MSVPVLHLVLAVTFVFAYVILTALGHDANALIAILGGQAAGAAVQKVGK